jgi:hypothetical protein
MADGRTRESEVTLYPLFGLQTASGKVLVRLEMCNFCWGNLTFMEREVILGLHYVYLPFFSVVKVVNKF